MPKDSSGNYAQPAGTQAVSNTLIESADYNTLISDIGVTLTGDLPRNGAAGMTGNLPMGNNRITGLNAASDGTDAPTAAQVGAGTLNFYGNISGTNTKTVVATNFAPAAYADGVIVRGRNVTANTDQITLQLGALAAEPVFKVQDDAVVQLTGGELPADHLPVFEYHTALDSGSGGWMLLNPAIVTSNGIAETSGELQLDLTTLTDEPNATELDELIFGDQSNSFAPRSMTVANLFRTITTFTELTTPDFGFDDLVIFDQSELAVRRISPFRLQGFVPLSVQTASSSSQIDLVLDNDTYKSFRIVIRNWRNSTNASGCHVRVRRDGQGAVDSGASDYAWIVDGQSLAGSLSTGLGASAEMRMVNAPSAGLLDTGNGLNAVLDVVNADEGREATITGRVEAELANASISIVSFSGRRLIDSAIDLLRFLPDTGNITAGTFVLWGSRDPS